MCTDTDALSNNRTPKSNVLKILEIVPKWAFSTRSNVEEAYAFNKTKSDILVSTVCHLLYATTACRGKRLSGG